MNDHDHVAAADPQLLRVIVSLDPGAWHGHANEILWALPLGKDLYSIRNVPFFAKGLSYGDIVSATHSAGDLKVAGVSRRGGHSTYRVVLPEPFELELFSRIFKPLGDHGCTYERATDHLVAIDVPPEADIHKVYQKLEAAQTAGQWDFEEGHCGHQLEG